MKKRWEEPSQARWASSRIHASRRTYSATDQRPEDVLLLCEVPDGRRQERRVPELARHRRAPSSRGRGHGRLRPGAARVGEGRPGLDVRGRPQGVTRCGRDLRWGYGPLFPLLRGSDRVGPAIVAAPERDARGPERPSKDPRFGCWVPRVVFREDAEAFVGPV